MSVGICLFYIGNTVTDYSNVVLWPFAPDVPNNEKLTIRSLHVYVPTYVHMHMHVGYAVGTGDLLIADPLRPVVVLTSDRLSLFRGQALLAIWNSPVWCTERCLCRYVGSSTTDCMFVLYSEFFITKVQLYMYTLVCMYISPLH